MLLTAKHKPSKEELHSIVKDVLKQSKEKAKRRCQRDSDKVSEELHASDKINLSDSSGDEYDSHDESNAST